MDKQDFNQLVELAMRAPGLSAMRPVVEKEILHYDIFQALDAGGLLKGLVFQGGTSLRLCRGSQRFSEDLDFAGGANFTASKMVRVKECLEGFIGTRYGFNVLVTEPKESGLDAGNVKVCKWQVSVETSPGQRDVPQQRIKLEVANIPAYTQELVPLRTNYDFLKGYNNVLVVAESMAEVMADKVLAFPASTKIIRHRDIWDLAWLTQQGVALDAGLVEKKINDYGLNHYASLLDGAMERLPEIVKSQPFKDQMRRFIDAQTFAERLDDERFLGYLISTVGGIFREMKAHLSSAGAPVPIAFKM